MAVLLLIAGLTDSWYRGHEELPCVKSAGLVPPELDPLQLQYRALPHPGIETLFLMPVYFVSPESH